MSRFAGWLRAEGLLWIAVALGVLFSGLAGSVVGFKMSVRRTVEAERERDEARAKVAAAESRATAAEVKVAPWIAEANAAKAKAEAAEREARVKAALVDAQVAAKLIDAKAAVASDVEAARKILARDDEEMEKGTADLKPMVAGDKALVWSSPDARPPQSAMATASTIEMANAIKFLFAQDSDGLDGMTKNGRLATLESGTQLLIVKHRDGFHFGDFDVPDTYEARVKSGPHAGELIHVMAAQTRPHYPIVDATFVPKEGDPASMVSATLGCDRRLYLEIVEVRKNPQPGSFGALARKYGRPVARLRELELNGKNYGW